MDREGGMCALGALQLSTPTWFTKVRYRPRTQNVMSKLSQCSGTHCLHLAKMCVTMHSRLLVDDKSVGTKRIIGMQWDYWRALQVWNCMLVAVMNGRWGGGRCKLFGHIAPCYIKRYSFYTVCGHSAGDLTVSAAQFVSPQQPTCVS